MASVLLFGDLPNNYGYSGYEHNRAVKFGFLLVTPSQKLFRFIIGWHSDSLLQKTAFLVAYVVSGLFILDAIGYSIIGLGLCTKKEAQEDISFSKKRFFQYKTLSKMAFHKFQKLNKEVILNNLDEKKVIENGKYLLDMIQDMENRECFNFFIPWFKQLLEEQTQDNYPRIASLTYHLFEFSKIFWLQLKETSEWMIFRDTYVKGYGAKSEKLEDAIRELFKGVGFIEPEKPSPRNQDPKVMTKSKAYSILLLDKGASKQAIQKAFKTLRRIHHPDKNQGDIKAHERFIQLYAAYECLIPNR